MMLDTIADMLTRIRNASAVKKTEVLVPYSKINFNIAQILQKEKYVGKSEILEDGVKQIKIDLIYDTARKPAIQSIKRVSRIGQRIYVGKDAIPAVLNGYGISIISTSTGLLTDRQAKKRGIGGEVLCEIY
jgi:small subunit ribosomal protein S8